MEKRIKLPDKALLASYKVSELIAKKQKAHTIGEELILPACKELVATMLGPEAVEQISKVPLSNDTVYRRILDISINIQSNVREVLANTQFALQLDESTDISGKAQLISFVRFVYGPEIIKQFLVCRELKTTTTGTDIFSTVDTFFQDHGLKTDCIAICTDGAAAVTGNVKEFLS
ncbi:protein FAM200C-like [Diabrotica undecimpunctata]|uniref:protein FAM200C-like n=1 Tax=Diabrotica undecimpunctata TaxID=50387 RepID=UPI003B6402B1